MSGLNSQVCNGMTKSNCKKREKMMNFQSNIRFDVSFSQVFFHFLVSAQIHMIVLFFYSRLNCAHIAPPSDA
jgi:hypothetical protein